MSFVTCVVRQWAAMKKTVWLWTKRMEFALNRGHFCLLDQLVVVVVLDDSDEEEEEEMY